MDWKIRSFSPNLERLVLRYIDSYDSESSLIFHSIFRELQDLQSFAPLRSQNVRKKSPDFFSLKWNFHFHSCKIRWISSFFCWILMKFCRNFKMELQKIAVILDIFIKLPEKLKIQKKSFKNAWIFRILWRVSFFCFIVFNPLPNAYGKRTPCRTEEGPFHNFGLTWIRTKPRYSRCPSSLRS